MEPLVVSINTEHIESQIVERAAHLLLERLQDTVEREARNRIIPAIDAALGTLVESALTRVFTPVNAFGEPTGDKTTIASLLSKKADEFLSEKVSVNGRTDGYGDKRPRYEYIVGKMLQEAFDSQVQKEVKAIAADAKAQAKTAVTKLLVEQLSK